MTPYRDRLNAGDYLPQKTQDKPTPAKTETSKTPEKAKPASK